MTTSTVVQRGQVGIPAVKEGIDHDLWNFGLDDNNKRAEAVVWSQQQLSINFDADSELANATVFVSNTLSDWPKDLGVGANGAGSYFVNDRVKIYTVPMKPSVHNGNIFILVDPPA